MFSVYYIINLDGLYISKGLHTAIHTSYEKKLHDIFSEKYPNYSVVARKSLMELTYLGFYNMIYVTQDSEYKVLNKEFGGYYIKSFYLKNKGYRKIID